MKAITLTIAILMSTSAFSACKLGVMFLGASPSAHLADELVLKVEEKLLDVNGNNSVSVVYTMSQANKNDYLLTLSQKFDGYTMDINDHRTHSDIYNKSYTNSQFDSIDNFVSTLAADFASNALSLMKDCK